MKTVKIKKILLALVVSLSGSMALSAVAAPAHDVNHKNHADCVRTNALNKNGPAVKRVSHAAKIKPWQHRQVKHVAKNMSKVKRVSKIHNPNHANHADCVRTEALNKSGPAVRVVSKK